MRKNKFYGWLKNNTTLSESSIKQYYYVIKKFKQEVKEIEIDKINEFITDNFREKRNYHYKFAIKHYLKYLGREDLINQLAKVKIKPRKKIGHYYDKNTILRIINGLNYYKIVGLIQFITGARARAVLSFHRDKLIKEEKGIRLALKEKGDKEVVVYIPKPYSEEVIKVIDHRKTEYPFLKGKSHNFATLLENNYRYYLDEIKKSCESIGVKFNTHDFRRNFAQIIYKKSGRNISIVKAMLKHNKLATTEKYIGEFLSKEEFDKLIEDLFS